MTPPAGPPRMSWWALCSSTRANTRNTAAPRRKARQRPPLRRKNSPSPRGRPKAISRETVMQAMAAPGIVPYPSIFIPPFSTGPGVLSRPAFGPTLPLSPGRKSRVSAKKVSFPLVETCVSAGFTPVFPKNGCPGALCIEMRARREKQRTPVMRPPFSIRNLGPVRAAVLPVLRQPFSFTSTTVSRSPRTWKRISQPANSMP